MWRPFKLCLKASNSVSKQLSAYGIWSRGATRILLRGEGLENGKFL